MSLHLLPAKKLSVYLTFRRLPESCRPAYVVRERGVTYQAIDPRTTCREAMMWGARNLTDDERLAYRLAYGGPGPGQPCPDEWFSDEPVSLHIPESLRLPGAPTARGLIPQPTNWRRQQEKT